jgi:cytochrome c oxidase subunit 2
MRTSRLLTGLAAGFLALGGLTGLARAEDGITGLPVIGAPHLEGIALQTASGVIATDQHWLDGMLLYICFGVVALVMLLLAFVILRFNQRANPTPARFTHNTPLEIVWTLVPILILVTLGSFSLPVLFKQLEIPKADVLVKITGNQWYWSYEYPDLGVSFDSMRVDGTTKVASLGADQPMGDPQIHNDIADMKLKALGYTPDQFLLAVDNAMVVPVGKTIVMHVTGADVIHGWYVPALAQQHSAVPGRTGEMWFKTDTVGVYFGQCTNICGKDHAYMPIVVKVVDQPTYDAWVARFKSAANQTGPAAVQVASN